LQTSNDVNDDLEDRLPNELEVDHHLSFQEKITEKKQSMPVL
jgi:hypothetical protein